MTKLVLRGFRLNEADPYFDTRRDQIVAFAARQRLPAIYQFRQFAVAGGVLSYGFSFTDLYRQVGLYAAKILGGTKPAASRCCPSLLLKQSAMPRPRR